MNKTRKFLALEDDRPLLRALLAQAVTGQRFRSGPIRFHGPGNRVQTLELSGYGVPNIGEHYYLTVCMTQMSILCHNPGITTFAKGIESESILDLLRDYCIIYVQGFVFIYVQGFVFGSQEGLTASQISK